MKDSTKLVVAIVILVGAGAYLAYFFSSQPAPGETVQHLQPLCCSNCNKAFEQVAGDPPVKCKFCGEKTAWRAAVCGKCGRLAPLVKSADGKTDFKCAKCGNRGLREVTPEDIAKHTP